MYMVNEATKITRTNVLIESGNRMVSTMMKYFNFVLVRNTWRKEL